MECTESRIALKIKWPIFVSQILTGQKKLSSNGFEINGTRLICFSDVLDAEPEVTNSAGQILLDEDVLGFEVAVRNGRLALSPVDGHVQMSETG